MNLIIKQFSLSELVSYDSNNEINHLVEINYSLTLKPEKVNRMFFGTKFSINLLKTSKKHDHFESSSTCC